MDQLDRWREWADGLLMVYYGVDTSGIERDDVALRAALSLHLGIGAGATFAIRRDLTAIQLVVESALSRLGDTARDAVPRRREPARHDASDGANDAASVGQGGDDVAKHDDPEAEPKL